MMSLVEQFIQPILLCAIVTCGVMAGIFFTFSVFVMKALSLLPAHEGMAAMQSINEAILNPIFFLVFIGTPVMCMLAVVFALSHWGASGSLPLLIGAVMYLLGCLLVTAVCNVPMNNALAATSATNPDATSVWSEYLKTWTLWNHVRTMSSLAAFVLFVLALQLRAAQ
jgi:uncharacterized membrane protein